MVFSFYESLFGVCHQGVFFCPNLERFGTAGRTWGFLLQNQIKRDAIAPLLLDFIL